MVWESLTKQKWSRWEEQDHDLTKPYALIHSLEEWHWVVWEVDYIVLVERINRCPKEKGFKINRFRDVFKIPGRANIEGKQVFIVFQSLGKKDGMIFSAYHQSKLLLKREHVRLRKGTHYYALTREALEKIYGNLV